MVSLMILHLIIIHSFSDELKRSPFSFFPNIISHKKHNPSDSINLSNNSSSLLSLKLQDDLVCDENDQTLQINDYAFQNPTKIINNNGCISITISKCTFSSIVIPDTPQPNEQMSIIYVKSANFLIDASSFTECYSNSKISRIDPSILLIPENISPSSLLISDFIICHAIYLDENFDHETKIINCDFKNNGDTSQADGTIIYSNKAQNLQVEFCNFESNTYSTRAIETLYTKNTEFNMNTFTKMIGSKCQNGGALLLQFANNIAINDCIFDSNNLQPGDSTDPEVCGSAFFINLNETLTFTNNTIKNHATYLNSIITFNAREISSDSELNADDLPIKRKVQIIDSKYISNSYSKTPDGNGIGILIEDYSEHLLETSDDEPYLISVEFSYCIFDSNGNNNCKASVLQWTRKTSYLSFESCSFKSNIASPGSSMFKILNGPGFNFDSCEIDEINGFSFLSFQPLTTEEQNSKIKIIEVSIKGVKFTNAATSTEIQSHFIATESTTVYDYIFTVSSCVFTNILLRNSDYVIQSNSAIFQVTDCQISYDKIPGKSAISSTKSDANITVIDSEFTRCLHGIYLHQLADTATIRNCVFAHCRNTVTDNQPVLYCYSKTFIAERVDISFDPLANSGFISFGIQIEQTMNAEIIQSTFTNTRNSAIRSFYKLESSSLTIMSCTSSGIDHGCFPFHSKNDIINFINNSINNPSDEKCFGLLIEATSNVKIDGCKFLNCFNDLVDASYVKYGSAISYLNDGPNPDESITISNCEFDSCTSVHRVFNFDSYFAAPNFINTTITGSTGNYIIYATSDAIPPASANREFIFINVSFTDIVNNADTGGGIGLYFQPQPSSDFTLSFYGCNFLNTTWTSTDNDYGGGAISIESANCQMYHVSIIGCSFYNCVSDSFHGAAIAVISEKSIVINDCYIENCTAVGKSNSINGGVIFCNQTGEAYDFNLLNVTINGTNCGSIVTGVFFFSVISCKYTVSNCSFINCNKQSLSPGSVIQIPQRLKEFNCLNTSFIFDEFDNTNSRGANVFTPTYKFESCYFYQCGNDYDQEKLYGGGINYDEPANLFIDEEIEISLCTFEKCYAINTATFRLTLYNGLPTLYNNSFLDVTAKYVLALMFKENVQFDHIIFEKHYFFRCNNLQKDGGGSGIWVNNHRADGNVYPTYIDFIECYFIENRATDCDGGAFGVGVSPSVRPTQLSFKRCEFIGNSCTGKNGGGAIWIRTSIPSSVSSCIFKDNYAGNDDKKLNGGAIYIRFTTSVPEFRLIDSEFINNSCVNPESHGHAIFGIYLFSSLVINNCSFINNGIKENPDSIIHTDSNLEVRFSFFVFTDKKESFSRALFVGSSSMLTVYKVEFINCTDLKMIAGSIYYEIVPARVPQSVGISFSTFDSNTEGTACAEIFLKILDVPYLCSNHFKNENTLSSLIVCIFDEDHPDFLPAEFAQIDDLTFTNCNLNKNSIFRMEQNSGDVVLEEFLFLDARFISCTDFSIIQNSCYDFMLTGSTFVDNRNDDFLLKFNVLQSLLIEDNVFSENKISSVDGDESRILFVEEAEQTTIVNTSFASNELEKNGCVLKFFSNCELRKISMLNCSHATFSIYFHSSGLHDLPSEFSMTESTINDSGTLKIDSRVDQIMIQSCYLSNSSKGLIYDPETVELTEDSSNSIAISHTTFDNFTDRALYLFVYASISMLNNTIKNCRKIDTISSDCLPICELVIKTNSTDHLAFEQFVFENNQFNNSNDRMVNGGGIGLFISSGESEEERTVDANADFQIEFIDCRFISNKADHCGGAYAFVENDEGMNISNSSAIHACFSFHNCTFKKNSCRRLKGHALYIEASNVTIDECVFESHELEGDISSNSVEEVQQSSVVFISSDKNETLMIQNCSFLSNKASSLYISSDDEIYISGCLFESNDILPINSTYLENSSLNDEIVSSSIVTIVRAKDSITIENCTFLNNSEAEIGSGSTKDDEDDGKIIKSAAVFANTEKSFTMSNANFLDNNVNDLILNAALDVSIADCQFIELENSSAVAGCALIIKTKSKVLVRDCTFSGYASSAYHGAPNGHSLLPAVLTPIHIDSGESIELANVVVGDVSGDVFNLTADEGIRISNCELDPSKDGAVGKQSRDLSEVTGSGSFFMLICCEKMVSIDSVSIANYDKGVAFVENTESITFTNSRMESCRAGVISGPESEDAAKGGMNGTSFLIRNVTFYQLENAILLKKLTGQISFEKTVFSKCDNPGNGEATIGFTLCSCSSPLKISFSEVIFEGNRNTQFSEADRSAIQGGIGFDISLHESSTKAAATVEFSDCNFTSNSAAQSGGALCFSPPDSISFELVSFKNCTFSMNRCNSSVGALSINASTSMSTRILDCSFIMNEAKSNIGAAMIDVSQRLLIECCTFLNNSAIEPLFGPRIDSLFVSTSSSADVISSNFSKAVFIDEEVGYQAVFLNKITDKSKLLFISDCLFAIVNPVTPQVLFMAQAEGANTTVNSSSFTHFYAVEDADGATKESGNIETGEGAITTVNSSSFTHFYAVEDADGATKESGNIETDEGENLTSPLFRTKIFNSNTHEITRANSSSYPFYQVECDANAKIIFVGCCFDTNRTFTISPVTRRTAPRKTKNDLAEEANFVFVESKFEDKEKVCAFPEIVDELISAIAEPKNQTDSGNDDDDGKRSRKMLIIGLSVGAAALVLVAVVIVVVAVHRKRNKVLKKTMEFDDDCQNKLEQEEIEAINQRYGARPAGLSLSNSKSTINKVENLYNTDDNDDETDMDEFDI